MKTSRSKKMRGFTLVELMVAIVIVAALSSMAFAAVKSVKAKANQAACANNMRQIGVALQAYANDHRKYPDTTHTASLSQAWIYQLEDYLGDFDHVRICPADPKAEEREKFKGTSYVLNSFVFVQQTDPFGNPVGQAMNRPTALRDPSRTIMAFCCSDHVPAGPGNDHTHSERWNSWAAVERDISTDRHGGKRSNYLYADGRVESFLETEVQEKIESGENFAEPPGYGL